MCDTLPDGCSFSKAYILNVRIIINIHSRHKIARNKGYEGVCAFEYFAFTACSNYHFARVTETAPSSWLYQIYIRT